MKYKDNILSTSSESIRINKFLSKYGYCSRRVADKLITDNLVYINDDLATLGSKVLKDDNVYIYDNTLNCTKKIEENIEYTYIAFNKPLGITTTTCKTDKTNIIDFINYKKRIFPIGRLDKNSHGLILLTNDGDIVNKILRSENNHEKEYIVKVDKFITNEFITKMGTGVRVLGQMTKPCKVSKINNFTFKITLTQGLNRQIRRMCEALNYRVENLKRIRIINILLSDLKVGEYRHLTKEELLELFSIIKYNKNVL